MIVLQSCDDHAEYLQDYCTVIKPADRFTGFDIANGSNHNPGQMQRSKHDPINNARTIFPAIKCTDSRVSCHRRAGTRCRQVEPRSSASDESQPRNSIRHQNAEALLKNVPSTAHMLSVRCRSIVYNYQITTWTCIPSVLCQAPGAIWLDLRLHAKLQPNYTP